MNDIFELCVKLLVEMAHFFGITYEEINVIIFCILGPIVFIIQLIYIIYLRKKVKKLSVQG